MIKQYKDSLEDPNAVLFGRRIDEPLEKKVGPEDEHEIDIRFKKRYLTRGGAVKALAKIKVEYGGNLDSITMSMQEMAYTRKRIICLHGHHPGRTDAKRSGTSTEIWYEGGFIPSIEISLYGKESEVKKEREILRKLL